MIVTEEQLLKYVKPTEYLSFKHIAERWWFKSLMRGFCDHCCSEVVRIGIRPLKPVGWRLTKIAMKEYLEYRLANSALALDEDPNNVLGFITERHLFRGVRDSIRGYKRMKVPFGPQDWRNTLQLLKRNEKVFTLEKLRS